jgi:monovalent cation/hydrogen antiporter
VPPPIESSLGSLGTEAPAAATILEIVFLLLIVSTVLAVVARRIGIPYPVLLVLGGVAIGLIPGLPDIELQPDLVFVLFLPPILYAAGYFTSIPALRAKLQAVTLLAVGLVIFTAVVVAAVAHAVVPSMSWAVAFTLGAIVAPPDAVAATTVFQRLGVPRRIAILLEEESLLNDATALVLYRLAVGAALGGSFSILDAGSTFVVSAVGGVAVGLLVGIAVSWILSRVDDEVFSVVVSFLAPVSAYVPADQLHLSGVLATVVAGIWAGRHASTTLSSRVRVSAFASWQILLFLVNGAVFILIGLTLPRAIAALSGRPTTELIWLAVAVAGATILARVVWVFPALALPPGLRRRRPGSHPAPARKVVAIIAWAGMRGVVSLAAALALPLDFPERNLIIFLTFAVILATLVGQGLSLPLLIRRLGIEDGQGAEGQEEAFARTITGDAALMRLDDLAGRWPGHLELIDNLRAAYQHESRHLEVRQQPTAEDMAEEQELLEHREIRMSVLTAERESLANLRDRGAISDEIYRRLERDFDLEELRMQV